MTQFLADFGTFLTWCLSWLTQILNWYLSTIPGKITIYLIIISIIIGTIFYVIHKFKN